MSNWRNKIPHEQVESDPTKQNIITGQLHRLIKLGVLMPEASQISDTGIYVTIGLPSPTVTSKLQVGGTVAASEAEYDYELATLGQVKALAVPTLPQLKTINNESIVGTGNIVISGGVDITLGTQKNGLILVGQELSLGLATNLVSGALSNTDWDTFNSKQNALGFTPENIANKNQNNGYAGLDSTGKINPLHLPALAITDTFVVGSESEMLSLVAEVGDVAIRTDLNKSFILCVSGASTLVNWQELLTSVTVDQTIIDGSTNAVSGNAVFDGLALKANLASPAFSGTPTVPTAPAGNNSTQIASTAFVVTAISTAALGYVKTTGNQNVGGIKTFLAATVFDGELLVKQAVAGAYNVIKAVDGGMNFYNNSGTSFNFKLRNSSFEFGLSATLARIDSSLLTRYIQYNLPDSPSSSVTFALTVNPTAITAPSFVKSGAATANILLAGGGDIPQSTFATSFSPTFTGIPTAPTAAVGTNTTQIATTAFVLANSGGGISFLEHDDTGKTVWNNGKGDGFSNTSFGERALESNTTGNFNTAYGFSALWLNTTGAANTAIGVSALGNNIAGSNNTAIGVSALLNNTSGGQNVAIGGGSQSFNNTGGNNVSIGVESLGRNIAGNQNVAIGNDAGTYINLSAVPLTSSYLSIFIGHNTSALVDGSLNEIVIGYKAIGAGSNTVTLGNESITKTVLSGVIQKRYLDTAPASATATGTTGEIRVTSTHIYVCIATNTWVHSVLTTW